MESFCFAGLVAPSATWIFCILSVKEREPRWRIRMTEPNVTLEVSGVEVSGVRAAGAIVEATPVTLRRGAGGVLRRRCDLHGGAENR